MFHYLIVSCIHWADESMHLHSNQRVCSLNSCIHSLCGERMHSVLATPLTESTSDSLLPPHALHLSPPDPSVTDNIITLVPIRIFLTVNHNSLQQVHHWPCSNASSVTVTNADATLT